MVDTRRNLLRWRVSARRHPSAFLLGVQLLSLVLYPLFEMLDTLSWKGSSLRDNTRWFVMGQVCVASGYRGTGIFDGLYRKMAEEYRDRFDLTVTEVASRNTRSLRAHARVGFQTLHVYRDATTDEEWHVVALDLSK